MTHDHVEVPVEVGGETVPVDIGIAGAVRWLNGLPGVRTLASCQGGPPTANDPYVTFTCSAAGSLLEVMLSLRAAAPRDDLGIRPFVGSVEVCEHAGSLFYRLSWQDREWLLAWEEALP